MSVDLATVKRVAHLARIAVPEADLPKLQGELNAILGFVEPVSYTHLSSRATIGRPGIHAGTFPVVCGTSSRQVQAWIPGLRFASPGMTRV